MCLTRIVCTASNTPPIRPSKTLRVNIKNENARARSALIPNVPNMAIRLTSRYPKPPAIEKGSNAVSATTEWIHPMSMNGSSIPTDFASNWKETILNNIRTIPKVTTKNNSKAEKSAYADTADNNFSNLINKFCQNGRCTY